MPTHTSLKGFDHVSDSLLSDQLESNLVSFFQWGLLGKGGFWNVTIPTSGAYGGEESRLGPVDDPHYDVGQVWEAFRQDWVWETGVEYSEQPIRVSGVYVNGSFHPLSETGVYAHSIDYRYGRVIFDQPIGTGAVVECEYSYRMYGFHPSTTPWWRQLQALSYRVDDDTFLLMGSGVRTIMAHNRVQMPAVVVQVVPRSSRSGYEMGGSTQTVRQDCLFHIMAETPHDAGKLHDIITLQQEKRIIAYDKNLVLEEERFGLDADGMPAESGLMYPDLVKSPAEGGYGWRQVRFAEFSSTDQPDEHMPSLHTATVRGTFEVEVG